MNMMLPTPMVPSNNSQMLIMAVSVIKAMDASTNEEIDITINENVLAVNKDCICRDAAISTT
jgi:hypothetical protein